MMAVKLNARSFNHAKHLVREGLYVLDERDDWSEHQPSTQDENKFIEKHGWGEYSQWHLGVDDEEDVDTKARYKFPYGGFAKGHRCEVIAAEVRGAQRNYDDIKSAAIELREMLDEQM
jgi:hypothetical protein